MSTSVNIDELSRVDLSLICRGCLATSGIMKNMIEWGLLDDFYKLTNVQVNSSHNPSMLLCARCEEVVHRFRHFKTSCQEADRLLRSVIEKRLCNEQLDYSIASANEISSDPPANTVHTELSDNRLTIKIVAPHMDSKIFLPCLYCDSNFLKRTDLTHHLIKHHRVKEDFAVDLKYYCHIKNCIYRLDSEKEKSFAGRKFLNQHIFKVHRDKIACDTCKLTFFNEVDFKRHFKTCNYSYTYVCQVCEKAFKTYEIYLVHLLRKHPDLHKMYKNERKAEKRSLTKLGTKKIKVETNTVVSDETDKTESGKERCDSESNVDLKKVKIEFDKTEFLCDSPKRSFATQTLDLEKHIKNDVTLPSWQAEKSDDTKKDEMSTQTVFEDLLSLKSNISEDEAMFSDSVSLSDIQTQTLPLEFGLSRSNKETITSETQSPDLSIKETQTCLCLYESPRPNLSLRCTESVSSSPSTFGMLTSTETQTLDFRGTFYNDLLSFSSAETQTCFEDDSNKDL